MKYTYRVKPEFREALPLALPSMVLDSGFCMDTRHDRYYPLHEMR